MRQFFHSFRKFCIDQRGTIAVKFALFLPAIAMLSVGAIDLIAVRTSQAKLQAIADNAALAGGRSLGLAADGVVARERASAYVVSEMGRWTDAPTYTATFEIEEVDGKRSLRVLLEANRASFFGNILPPGGWNFSGDATASPVGQTPLCAIGTGTGNTAAISTDQFSKIAAPGCLIHSNGSINVGDRASITASLIQVVKTARGKATTPAAGEGAAPVSDPFETMSFPSGEDCRGVEKPGQAWPIVYADNRTHYLEPGLHCRPVTVMNDTRLILKPGVHVFRKNLTLLRSAKLSGEDVFLFFDHGSDTRFTGLWIEIDLTGRKSGPYAGMVMATTAGNEPDINLPGNRVRRLLGVVYAGNGKVVIGGTGVAASDSAWTVVVARQIQTTGTAAIQINSDYESSNVPVPIGVGPNAGGLGATGTRLRN